MNAVDLVLLAVFAFAVYDGVRRGFIASSFTLVVWAFAFAIAIALTRVLFAGYAYAGVQAGGMVRILAFSFALFVAAAWLVLGGRRVIEWTRTRLAGHPTLAFAERALGVFPSLLRTAIAASVLLAAVSLFPTWGPAREAVAGSVLSDALIGVVNALEPKLAQALGTDDQPLFLSVIGGAGRQDLNVPESTEATLSLDAELDLYSLLQRERASHGLPLLARDSALNVVARTHALEMFRLRYVSHYSPLSGSPADRLTARGIPYAVMGENVAYAPSADLAHQGFLRSRSHRANLLDPRFERVGIGALELSGIHGVLFVEVFLEAP